MENIKKRLVGFNHVNIMRWLLLTELVAMLVSTSAAVGVEFLLYLGFAVSAPLRNRLKVAARQPMVLMILVWGGLTQK